MLRFIFFILIAFLSGCNKVSDKATDISLVTDGQWKITQFIRDNEDVTSAFENYRFQFKNNKTVDAIKGLNIEQTGTWEPNYINQTIQSYFPTAHFPLLLLNGKWALSTATSTTVEATLNLEGERRMMKLTKV